MECRHVKTSLKKEQHKREFKKNQKTHFVLQNSRAAQKDTQKHKGSGGKMQTEALKNNSPQITQ